MRRTVRAVTRACVFCRKLYARAVQQKMDQLPKERVTPSPPFTTTGIDFAGPFYTKRGAVRKPTLVKTYIALFICFTTRAIHLEVVTNMSEEAFLVALRRFVSRSGLPRVIRTDNGTKFVSIDSKLTAMYQTLDKQESQQQISSYLSSHRIQWKRIPVRSPNFGGIWETGVRSAKRLLKKLTNYLTFTYEEFNKILTQVEAVLNSRPIAPLETISEEGLEALTPGHFLVGRALQSLPTDMTSSNRVSSNKRLNLLQKLKEEFWLQ